MLAITKHTAARYARVANIALIVSPGAIVTAKLQINAIKARLFKIRYPWSNAVLLEFLHI